MAVLLSTSNVNTVAPTVSTARLAPAARWTFAYNRPHTDAECAPKAYLLGVCEGSSGLPYRDGPAAPNRSQHRIPSTNQHPISMDTK